MSDPSKDLMAIAADIHDSTAGFTRFSKIHHIARSLMAERERCAAIGYRVCAETRHVTLGDKVRAAINQRSFAGIPLVVDETVPDGEFKIASASSSSPASLRSER